MFARVAGAIRGKLRLTSGIRIQLSSPSLPTTVIRSMGIATPYRPVSHPHQKMWRPENIPATTFRPLAHGMGEAVAKRTILRKRADGSMETWGDVAARVALGNCMVLGPERYDAKEHALLQSHIANASILLSGRHLQHGDETQPQRSQEVFTNCSTASTSFLLYYLLLNGSGVGRCYDDEICIVDWRKMPSIHPVISQKHQDYDYKTMESLEIAHHKFGKNVTVFEVPDSREGWAQAVEYIESMTHSGKHSKEIVLVDFTNVRPKGAPIGGMQGRPSAGPAPMMNALRNISTLKGAHIPKWRQALYVDHFLAECVLVGGARRAARMSTKNWRDPDILDFITVKQGGHLWSSNNSVTVDKEFWEEAACTGTWANQVFEAVSHASYHDRTGEPGFINQDKLVSNDADMQNMTDGRYAESKRFSATHGISLLSRLARIRQTQRFGYITNPCGEIVIDKLGAYCVIGDVVPWFCRDINHAEEAVRLTARALIRVNTMDCVYRREVDRTNRIGVSLTAIHEWAWTHYGFGFRDLLNENTAQKFWLDLARLARAVKDEASTYSRELGVNIPHTDTTEKPAGTTSKCFGTTEGAHLPSMREYLRWVQFRNDDPIIDEYHKLGYPIRKLKIYEGTTIVGFPTQPEICKLGMGHKLVTASEATPEEQYKWLILLEKYWIRGTDNIGHPLPRDTGNQISYTLKYDPNKVNYDQFKSMILKYQSRIRCCSVMPQGDTTAYEYQPEQPVNLQEYNAYVGNIRKEVVGEDVDQAHVECSTGACPIDFKKEKL